MSEPFVPTGVQFDEGDLPVQDSVPRAPAAPAAVQEAAARRVRDFVLDVGPSIDADLKAS